MKPEKIFTLVFGKNTFTALLINFEDQYTYPRSYGQKYRVPYHTMFESAVFDHEQRTVTVKTSPRIGIPMAVSMLAISTSEEELP